MFMANKTTVKDEQKKQRTMTGVVVSRAGDKTVGVTVARVKVHPLYHKRQVKQVKYLAHDSKNEVQIGDKVELKECRPMSAHKRWIIVNRIPAKGAVAEEE